jgi:hypothetical protein
LPDGILQILVFWEGLMMKNLGYFMAI